MSFLLLIRVFTLLLAALYSLQYVDYDALAMRFDPGLGITGETGHSAIITAGTVGIYVTAAISVALAFFGVHRWRYGVRALSWCFLLMGLSLLTRLDQCWWLRFLGWYTQIPAYVSTVCFSLPPLIMAAVLRQSSVEKELQRTV